MTDWYYQRFQPGAKTADDHKKRAAERKHDGFMDAQRAALGISRRKENTMSGLDGRIKKLENQAPTSKASDDLQAMRRRCEMMLEVLEPHETAQRDELIKTIKAIETGELTLDEPPHAIVDNDERARIMRERMLKEMGDEE